jgi:hypothetical protein
MTLKRVFSLSLILIVMSSVIVVGIGRCLSIELAWDPNPPEENVTGYKIYYGNEPGSYTYVIDVRNSTLKSVRLQKGYQYYFAVTAYNEAGQESEPAGPLGVNTCTHKLSPKKKTFKDIGGTGTVNVVTQPDCEWTAASSASWLRITEGRSGAGPGVITYSIEPNETYETRAAVSTFAGKFFTLKQKGKKPPK